MLCQKAKSESVWCLNESQVVKTRHGECTPLVPEGVDTSKISFGAVPVVAIVTGKNVRTEFNDETQSELGIGQGLGPFGATPSNHRAG